MQTSLERERWRTSVSKRPTHGGQFRFPHVYHRFYRRVAASEHRHSAESLALLGHLARSGPLTVTEAARHFERSQSAMSEIVARLEQRGLLEQALRQRTPDEREALVEAMTRLLRTEPGRGVAPPDDDRPFSRSESR